jgi:signal peptidase I
LALEAEGQVHSGQGEVLLELVESGQRFQCRLNVADGTATLTIDGGQSPFLHQAEGNPPFALSQQTEVRGPGSYHLRFANVDDQLLLWVDEQLVEFDVPGTEYPGAFEPLVENRPRWSPSEPGDLAPARVGGQGISLTVDRLRVLRDIYYVATSNRSGAHSSHEYQVPFSQGLPDIRSLFRTPEQWDQTDLFDWRRLEEFSLGADQFFPLGDNSPQSKDARLWSQKFAPQVESYVERELLTGKAFLIYWPHPWYAGTRALPIIPDFRRMGLIH